jgi:hypothetical protein
VRKKGCSKPEYKGENIQWLQEILASKGTPDVISAEHEDEGP